MNWERTVKIHDTDSAVCIILQFPMEALTNYLEWTLL